MIVSNLLHPSSTSVSHFNYTSNVLIQSNLLNSIVSSPTMKFYIHRCIHHIFAFYLYVKYASLETDDVMSRVLYYKVITRGTNGRRARL
jgi:hypothetical protein